jgi:hypothetical protein
VKVLTKLSWKDKIIIAALILLGFLPDPTDVVDFGLPLLEPLLAYGYYLWISKRK